jgi:hypothetical protein
MPGNEAGKRPRVNRGRRAILGFSILVASLGCDSIAADPAAVSSCNAYCAKYIAAACLSPRYATVDACKTTECARYTNVPAQCQTAVRIYYDCEQGQADICGSSGCSNELAAVTTCH